LHIQFIEDSFGPIGPLFGYWDRIYIFYHFEIEAQLTGNRCSIVSLLKVKGLLAGWEEKSGNWKGWMNGRKQTDSVAFWKGAQGNSRRDALGATTYVGDWEIFRATIALRLSRVFGSVRNHIALT